MIAKFLMAVTMALTAIGNPGATADVFQAGDHYLTVDSDGFLTLFEESNGAPGLQADPILILGQVLVEADRRVQL